jgi:hypothetical protein
MIINNKAASTVAVTGTTGESGFVHMTLLGTQATTTAVLTGTAWANGTASSLIYSDSVVVANGTGKSATKFGVAAA